MSEFYTKLSKDEVKKIVIDLMIENGATEDQSDCFDGDQMYEYFGYSDVKPCNGYVIKETEQHGGEGQGDEYWYIFTIIDEGGNKTHLKVEGWYDSWNGTTWDNADFDIVEPYEVKVTRWKSI